jgi:hypothetical protein
VLRVCVAPSLLLLLIGCQLIETLDAPVPVDAGAMNSAIGGDPDVSGDGGRDSDSGGGSGGAGGEGGMDAQIDAGPCGTDCPNTAPVCDEEASVCVQCLENEHCAALSGTPVCDAAERECVQCLGEGDCGGDTPACLDQECVECTESTHCSGDTPVCDTGGHTCVQCMADGDCGDPLNARCDDHVCKPCTMNEQCGHIEDKQVCDKGECVECTGTDYEGCGKDGSGDQLVCESLNRRCSITATEHSTDACGPCVSDAQCQPGRLCMPQREDAVEIGWFCLWRKAASIGISAPNGNCNPGPNPRNRPFVADFSGVNARTSIDAVTADVCDLRVSSCLAFNQFSVTSCTPEADPDDALLQCGHALLQDALCSETSASSGNFQCTMRCLGDDDCKPGVGCNVAATPDVCSLQ